MIATTLAWRLYTSSIYTCAMDTAIDTVLKTRTSASHGIFPLNCLYFFVVCYAVVPSTHTTTCFHAMYAHVHEDCMIMTCCVVRHCSLVTAQPCRAPATPGCTQYKHHRFEHQDACHHTPQHPVRMRIRTLQGFFHSWPVVCFNVFIWRIACVCCLVTASLQSRPQIVSLCYRGVPKFWTH